MTPLGPFKRPPREHQLRALAASADETRFALFMEQRTGKSQVLLDTAARAFRAGRVDSLLVIAPNGVHRNWVTEEAPEVLPDDVHWRGHVWRSGATARAALRDREELLTHQGLRFLSVNVEALTTPTCREYLTRFFRRRRVLAAVDESLDVSAPKAERTKVALKIGQRAALRRILDGTPAAARPLGLYSQCQFLEPGILGFNSFSAFRARYAKLAEPRDVGPCPLCAGTGAHRDRPCPRCGGGGRNLAPVITGYQHLDELQEKLKTFSFRVLRSECAELPPKVYQKVFFELTDVQRGHYERLKKQFATEIRGSELTAVNVLTRLLRLQQLTSNFAPVGAAAGVCRDCEGEGCDACAGLGIVETASAEVLTVDPARDPRLTAFLGAVRRLDGPGIVWARFSRDLDTLAAACAAEGWSTGRYDGHTVKTRDADRAAFQRGELRVLLGNQRAGGRGIDLSAATWVAYYSNDFPLRWRLQSEDRAQSLVKRDAVLYLDLIAENTVDEKIVATLRAGRSVADAVMGDPLTDWL